MGAPKESRKPTGFPVGSANCFTNASRWEVGEISGKAVYINIYKHILLDRQPSRMSYAQACAMQEIPECRKSRQTVSQAVGHGNRALSNRRSCGAKSSSLSSRAGQESQWRKKPVRYLGKSGYIEAGIDKNTYISIYRFFDFGKAG